ncbi:MAG: hypothetical protein Q9182_005689 [Xanthomendoza sp. 2 TL-2023]
MESTFSPSKLGIHFPTTHNRPSGFDSKIFTLIVGPEEKQFTAHASYLAQSPVFDRMCHGHFEESQTLQIRLPEDDPRVIKAVVQYLYSGSFQNFGNEEACGNTADAANQLAEIYSVAEKYGLNDLKALIVQKLGDITDMEGKAAEFLSVARKIYACTPDSDNIYRTFFKDTVGGMEKLFNLSQFDLDIFNECVSGGGRLAVDMVRAIYHRYARNLDTERTTTKKLVAEVDELKSQLSETKCNLKFYKDVSRNARGTNPSW